MIKSEAIRQSADHLNLDSAAEREGTGMASLASLGLGKTMERKLHAVGIHSAEKLAQTGSREAVFRLKAQYPISGPGLQSGAKGVL